MPHRMGTPCACSASYTFPPTRGRWGWEGEGPRGSWDKTSHPSPLPAGKGDTGAWSSKSLVSALGSKPLSRIRQQYLDKGVYFTHRVKHDNMCSIIGHTYGLARLVRGSRPKCTW